MCECVWWSCVSVAVSVWVYLWLWVCECMCQCKCVSVHVSVCVRVCGCVSWSCVWLWQWVSECTCGCECVSVCVAVNVCGCPCVGTFMWVCVAVTVCRWVYVSECGCECTCGCESAMFFLHNNQWYCIVYVPYVQISPNSKWSEYCTTAFLTKIFAFAGTKPEVLLLLEFFHRPSKARTRVCTHTKPASPAKLAPFHFSPFALFFFIFVCPNGQSQWFVFGRLWFKSCPDTGLTARFFSCFTQPLQQHTGTLTFRRRNFLLNFSTLCI